MKEWDGHTATLRAFGTEKNRAAHRLLHDAADEIDQLRERAAHLEKRLLSEEDVGRVARAVTAYLVQDHGILGVSASVGAIIEAACSSTRKDAKVEK